MEPLDPRVVVCISDDTDESLHVITTYRPSTEDERAEVNAKRNAQRLWDFYHRWPGPFKAWPFTGLDDEHTT